MHKFTHCVFSILLDNRLYEIYHQLYNEKYLMYPLIYTNNIRYYIHNNIPVLHTKFLFNQTYNHIITDNQSVNILKKTFRQDCGNLLVYEEDFNNCESLCSRLGIKYE